MKTACVETLCAACLGFANWCGSDWRCDRPEVAVSEEELRQRLLFVRTLKFLVLLYKPVRCMRRYTRAGNSKTARGVKGDPFTVPGQAGEVGAILLYPSH